MHGENGKRGKQFTGEIAVRHRIHAVSCAFREIQSLAHIFTVDRQSRSGKRAGPERHDIQPFAAVFETPDITLQLFDIGEQMVCEKNGLSVLNLAKWRSHIAVTVSDDLVHWSKPKAVITDAHGYETNERGKSISNPFLLPVGDKFRLYFSCGLTFIPDCGFCEPTYIGYAESDSPDGGFVVAKEPVLSPDPTSEYFNLCSGCLKVYAVKDGYIGVQNGLYENDGRSHSAILLLSSPDGLRFTVENMMVEPNEADETSWMHQFVYASHLVKDQNALRLYFNARDTADMLKGRECIGFAEATIAE